jgi:hypothetical protein
MNGFFITNHKASRINPTSYSLIDHIMTNNVTNDITSGSIICDISDHFPVLFSCKQIVNQKRDNSNLFRAFTYANKVSFRDDLRNVRWHHVLSSQNVDTAVDNFLDTFLTLFDLHFPLRKKSSNRNYVKINDFMTSALLVSRRRKNHLFKMEIANPSHFNVNSYRTYRNIYNAVIRKSKKMYYEDILHRFKSKPKKLWETLNIVNGRVSKSSKIHEIFSGHHYTNDPKEMAHI